MSEINFNLLGKVLFGEATPEEKKEFDEWLNQSAENKKIVEAYRDFCDNTAITEYDLDAVVAEDDDKNRDPRQVSDEKKFRYPYWAVAASLALLMGFLLYFFAAKFTLSVKDSVAENHPMVRSNGKGQKSKILLPDGSTVWLNASSSIEYPESFSDTLRKISLVGEAYFEVRKDSLRPFVVEAGHLKTTVLGTSFNISNYAEDDVAEVSLVSGKLSVVQENNSEVLLPGNEVAFTKSNGHFMKHPVDVQKIARWKDGILIFDHEALPSVIARLERWYDVTITFSGEPLPDWKFTGYFDNESLHNVLEVVCFGKNLNYKIQDKHVAITRKN